MFPAYGSTMIAASAVVSAMRWAAARSLNATVSVAAAVAADTPAESGRPSVTTPEPAFASKASA